MMWNNAGYHAYIGSFIGSFNGCLLHSIVKLHLNLFNLLFDMFYQCHCNNCLLIHRISSLFVSTYTCLSTCSFTLCLLWQSSQLLWPHKKPFTNYLYKIAFVDVVYSAYFLHILLLKHRDPEHPEHPKDIIKNLYYCH